MPRNFIGGLFEGTNYPYIKKGEDKAFFINTDKCNDMIIVDRKYFLENIEYVRSWALYFEKEVKIMEEIA